MATSLKNLSSYNPEEIPDPGDKIFGIVVSEWNTEITEALLEGALEALGKSGVSSENILISRVPGSFELPFGAQRMLDDHKPAAVICLGCVIQGETRHFDFICQSVADGIMELGIKHRIPVIFGVLTTNDLQQAKERSGGKHGNKGFEAGITALKLVR
jgi:6,7-dimethyl-8-ribityllumazine synthase